MKKGQGQFSEVTEPDVNSAYYWQQTSIPPPPPPSSPRARKWIPRMVLFSILLFAVAGLTLGLLVSMYSSGVVVSNRTPTPSSTAHSKLNPTPTQSPTTASTPAQAPTLALATCPQQVSINDAANVLDAAQICPEAARLSSVISIYTTNTFAGGDGDFDQQARALVTSPQMIVLAIDIDTQHQHAHVAIFGGISVPLTDHQYHDAVEAFNHTFQDNGDYTGATIAAIRSLQSSL